MLSALPTGARPGGPAWVPIVVFALPYLAGIFANVVTVRVAPRWPTMWATPHTTSASCARTRTGGPRA